MFKQDNVDLIQINGFMKYLKTAYKLCTYTI